MIASMKEIIDRSTAEGVRTYVIGMPHRSAMPYTDTHVDTVYPVIYVSMIFMQLC